MIKDTVEKTCSTKTVSELMTGEALFSWAYCRLVLEDGKDAKKLSQGGEGLGPGRGW